MTLRETLTNIDNKEDQNYEKNKETVYQRKLILKKLEQGFMKEQREQHPWLLKIHSSDTVNHLPRMKTRKKSHFLQHRENYKLMISYQKKKQTKQIHSIHRS